MAAIFTKLQTKPEHNQTIHYLWIHECVKITNFFLKSKGVTNTKSKLQVPSRVAEGQARADDLGHPDPGNTLPHGGWRGHRMPLYPCASYVTGIFGGTK